MSDIDREVAEKVMGWHVFSDEGGTYWDPARSDEKGRVTVIGNWSPSTRIDHAWEVVEKMRDLGWEVAVQSIESSDPDENWQVCINKPKLSAVWGAYDATAPLAICRAALEAVKG